MNKINWLSDCHNNEISRWEEWINTEGEEEHAVENFSYLVKSWWMDNVSALDTLHYSHASDTVYTMNSDGEIVHEIAELVYVQD